MGLFDFVKEAGKSIGMGVNLGKELIELGYKPEEFDINLDKGVVHIKGDVNTQAEKEKIILALGNIEGVSQVKDELTVKGEADKEAVFYTVKPGDSLSKIAKKHYGKATEYMIIFEANQPMLKSPDKIYPGQVLRIPAK